MRFTLFPLMSGSRPKVKYKMGVSNEVADDSKQRASLLLLQTKGIVVVDQLKDWGGKFLGCICSRMLQQTVGQVFPKWERLMRVDYMKLGRIGRRN